MSVPATDGGTVLIVDDTPANIGVLLDYLQQKGFKGLVARDGLRALEQAKRAQPDLILLDVVMPGIDGFETCARLKANPETAAIPVIFMTALTDTSDKVRAFQVGAVDYVTKPFQHEEVSARISTHLALRRLRSELEGANKRLSEHVAERTRDLRAALAEVEELKNRLHAENVYLQEEIKRTHNFDEIIGQSPPMAEVLGQIEQVAPTDATVLVLGETGTGKELIARAIHNHSPRAARPLVKVNCAALPATLIESELFGHEKGAFTGAATQRAGRFELADGGTIFLDEVGDLPIELQAKLLRVLQEGEFERIGGTSPIAVDVRVIAATNRNLERLIEEKLFREDLFYRLNVIPILLPPLRSRPDDVVLLARFFVDKYSKKLGRSMDPPTAAVLDRLRSYDWPGNVRELENVIERSLVLSSGKSISLDHAFSARRSPSASHAVGAASPSAASTLEEVERQHIRQVLEQTRWRIEGAGGAAVRLDLNPSTLRSRMRKLGINKPA